MLLFTVYPVVYNLWTSVHRVLLILPDEPFVGIGNYLDVMQSYYFWEALHHTFWLAVLAAPLITLIGMGVARLLLTPFRGRVIVRSVVILPWILPGAIAGVVWLWVFHDTWGIINVILTQTGVIEDNILFMSNPWLARLAVLIGHTWMQFPFATILMMAAFGTIDPQLYEAAQIDGADNWDQFRFITFPQIKPMIVVLLAYESIQALTLYDLTYALTAGGPGTATTLISYHIYKESFMMLNFGNGAALGFLVVVLTIIFIQIILRAMPTDIFVEED